MTYSTVSLRLKSALKPAILLGSLFSLGACATQKEVPIIQQPVTPEIIETCLPISALEKVIIPAEYREGFSITQIENPPYEPIESRVPYKTLTKPEEIIFVDSEGKQVLDVCDVDNGVIINVPEGHEDDLEPGYVPPTLQDSYTPSFPQPQPLPQPGPQPVTGGQ